jgi:hypothetical protein
MSRRSSSVVCYGPGTFVFSLVEVVCLIGLPFRPTSVKSDLLKLPPLATLLHRPRVGSIVRRIAGVIILRSGSGLGAGLRWDSSTLFPAGVSGSPISVNVPPGVSCGAWLL